MMLMLLLQAAGAGTASAATTCRQYDGFSSGTAVLSNVRICVAPASDFPTYSGWGRVVQKYSTTPDVCGFSLLPFDIDEPRPAYACIAMVPQPVEAWRWTGSTWVRSGLEIGTQAYFAPYASGWRWAWTQRTGWLAIAESHAAYRWRA